MDAVTISTNTTLPDAVIRAQYMLAGCVIDAVGLGTETGIANMAGAVTIDTATVTPAVTNHAITISDMATATSLTAGGAVPSTGVVNITGESSGGAHITCDVI